MQNCEIVYCRQLNVENTIKTLKYFICKYAVVSYSALIDKMSINKILNMSPKFVVYEAISYKSIHFLFSNIIIYNTANKYCQEIVLYVLLKAIFLNCIFNKIFI